MSSLRPSAVAFRLLGSPCLCHQDVLPWSWERTDRQPISESKTPSSREKGPEELVTELTRQEAGRPQNAPEDHVCRPPRKSPLGMGALPKAGLALNEVLCVLQVLEFSAGVSSQCEIVAKETLTCLHIHFPTLVLQRAGCLPPLRSQGAS